MSILKTEEDLNRENVENVDEELLRTEEEIRRGQVDENFVMNQVNAFLSSNIAGVMWLGIYDVLKIIRYMTVCNRVVMAICDIVFWLIGAILVLVIALIFNDGYIRSYLFIGMFFGAILYMLTIGNILKRIARIVCKKLRPVISRIKQKKDESN